MKKLSKKLRNILLLTIIFMSILGVFSTNSINSTNERTNILIFGIDGNDGNGTRADSIMLLSIDNGSSELVLLSIPRDTRVAIPGRKSLDKINHAHAYGGAKLLMTTVEELFEMPIHYYAKINYKAVEELIDALGGIELNVSKDMKYKDPYDNPPLNIDISKGTQKLNGIDALHYLRYRSGYPNQDLGRIEAQQHFASSLKEQIISPKALLRYPTLAKIFFDNVDTNISKRKMLYLAYKSVIRKPNDFIKLTVPGFSEMIKGVSYYIVSTEDIENIKREYLSPSIKLTDDIKIEVLNGCGVHGAAAKAAKEFEELNIFISKIGNYEVHNIEHSFIKYQSKHKQDAKKIGRLLEIHILRKIEDKTDKSDIKIIIGRDRGF